jgi:hypothetical protein
VEIFYNRPVVLWSLRIKSDHLKMPRLCAVEFHADAYSSEALLKAPRACPAEFHASGYCSKEREAPRDKPVAPHAVWLGLLLKERKPTAKFMAPLTRLEE